jgi:hypothetical protein
LSTVPEHVSVEQVIPVLFWGGDEQNPLATPASICPIIPAPDDDDDDDDETDKYGAVGRVMIGRGN